MVPTENTVCSQNSKKSGMLLKLIINKLKKVVKTQSHKNEGLLAVKWSQLVILETRLNSLPNKLL